MVLNVFHIFDKNTKQVKKQAKKNHTMQDLSDFIMTIH